MNIFEKILVISMLLGFTYLFNRYLVRGMISILIGFHRKYNPFNYLRPIQYIIEKEENIKKVFTTFYWFGAGLLSFVILARQ